MVMLLCSGETESWVSIFLIFQMHSDDHVKSVLEWIHPYLAQDLSAHLH